MCLDRQKKFRCAESLGFARRRGLFGRLAAHSSDSPRHALTSSFTISRQLYWENVVPTFHACRVAIFQKSCAVRRFAPSALGWFAGPLALVVIKQTLLLHQEKTENGVDLSNKLFDRAH